jgi:predicted nucleic acid-binding protein
MYLVGSAHPNKLLTQKTLKTLLESRERFVTSVEVYQEILHRYVAIDRKDAIHSAFEVLNEICEEIYPIEYQDIEKARSFVLDKKHASARDSLHVAVMARRDVNQVFSFDKGFDDFPGVLRFPK